MPFQSALPLQEACHRRRNLRFALVAANVAVLLLLALLAFLVLRENRNAYDARARDTAQAMATIAQANVESELSRIDVLMRVALDELATARVPGPENDAAINRSLAAYQRLLPGVEGLRWADAEGALRWGNDLPPGAAIDVSDRAYFQRARAQPWTPDPLLAGPLKSRVSGHWVIAIVRPVVRQNRFDGVLYATLDVDHFQSSSHAMSSTTWMR